MEQPKTVTEFFDKLIACLPEEDRVKLKREFEEDAEWLASNLHNRKYVPAIEFDEQLGTPPNEEDEHYAYALVNGAVRVIDLRVPEEVSALYKGWK